MGRTWENMEEHGNYISPTISPLDPPIYPPLYGRTREILGEIIWKSMENKEKSSENMGK